MLALAAFVTACEGERVFVPVTKSQLVVHGLIIRPATVQRVLLERTLTGAVPARLIVWGDVSPIDPIVTDGGIPESNATAQLTLPGGQVVQGVEVLAITNPPTGAGVYQFTIPAGAGVPGTYRLRMVSSAGEEVTAVTTLMDTVGVITQPLAAFNRSRDTLTLSWAATPGARGYQVRIETPHGPWTGFTDKASITVTGGLRNAAEARFPSVFMPGFRQQVTISAVDANVYDYYRSFNSGFSGSGIINRIEGGLGVFGAQVVVARRTVEVSAQVTQPIEGTFQLITGPQGYPYGGFGDAARLRVYVDAPATRAGQSSAISVGYDRSNGVYGGGAVGTYDGRTLKLAFLRYGLIKRDTLDRYTAELRGDTLVGTFSRGAPALYVRVPSP